MLSCNPNTIVLEYLTCKRSIHEFLYQYFSHKALRVIETGNYGSTQAGS